MSVSAAHFKEVTNGYEKRTDGLWVHVGRLIVRGGPVELPAGSVTSDMLAGGAVARVLYDASVPGDLWTNVALSGGYNGFPGFPVTLTLAGGSALVLLQGSAWYGGGAVGAVNGWTFLFQGTPHTHLSRQPVTATNTFVSVAGTAFVAGPLVGGRQFGPSFYSSIAFGSGWYLRPSTGSPHEYLRFTVLELK